MKVRAVFIHPVGGIRDVIVANVESVKGFEKQLKEHDCAVLFIEEVKEESK